jgi:hypothetical protein
MVKRTEAAKSSTPSQKEIDEAVEKSGDFLEEQAQPPESHPKPTTPSSSEVEAAVEQSAEFLEEQGVTTTGAAAPVSAGTNAVGAAPVYAGRDKSADAAPVFETPIPDRPKD